MQQGIQRLSVDVNMYAHLAHAIMGRSQAWRNKIYHKADLPVDEQNKANANMNQSAVLTENETPPRDANQQGGRELRRAPRRNVHFDALITITSSNEEEPELRLKALSREASSRGASFLLSHPADILDKIAVGTEVIIKTDLNLLRGVVNGKWTEPKDAAQSENIKPYLSIKLLDDATWI